MKGWAAGTSAEIRIYGRDTGGTQLQLMDVCPKSPGWRGGDPGRYGIDARRRRGIDTSCWTVNAKNSSAAARPQLSGKPDGS